MNVLRIMPLTLGKRLSASVIRPRVSALRVSPPADAAFWRRAIDKTFVTFHSRALKGRKVK